MVFYFTSDVAAAPYTIYMGKDKRGPDQARLARGRLVPRGQTLLRSRLPAAAAGPGPGRHPPGGAERLRPPGEGQQHPGLQAELGVGGLHALDQPAQNSRHGRGADRLPPQQGGALGAGGAAGPGAAAAPGADALRALPGPGGRAARARPAGARPAAPGTAAAAPGTAPGEPAEQGAGRAPELLLADEGREHVLQPGRERLRRFHVRLRPEFPGKGARAPPRSQPGAAGIPKIPGKRSSGPALLPGAAGIPKFPKFPGMPEPTKPGSRSRLWNSSPGAAGSGGGAGNSGNSPAGARGIPAGNVGRGAGGEKWEKNWGKWEKMGK
uniref:coiled-coil domain-containing protein 25 isoform X1 n=1 Tax=Lonchura striata TaxID=40157 RepID=UPI000B4D24BB|nr:coiled-coil domain-containing protein 25 isoform X1 [Lonchura striata domestica]